MEISVAKIERLRQQTGISYEEARETLAAAGGDLLDAVILLESRGRADGNGAGYSTVGAVPMRRGPIPGMGMSGQGSAAAGQGGAPGNAPGGGNANGSGPGGNTAGGGGGFGFGGNAPGGGPANPGAGASQTGAGTGAGANPGGGPQQGYTYSGHYYQNGGKTSYNYYYTYRDEHTGFDDLMRRFGAFLKKALHASLVNYFEIWRRGERIVHFPVLFFIILLIPWFWLTLVLLAIGLFFGWRYHFSGPNLGKEAINRTMDGVSEAADRIKQEVREAAEAEKAKEAERHRNGGGNNGGGDGRGWNGDE
ncbi:MAG: hypothetical protein LBS85_01975 [Clostridiales Family XIII bacterium]|jgi:hypothetical protein|nr:hypothetical protein [Clostridiales Family XIII bacterium]